MKGVLPWLVRLACRVGTRDFCSALAAVVGPVQNILFHTVHYFNFFVPSAQQAGQAAVLGRLSFTKDRLVQEEAEGWANAKDIRWTKGKGTEGQKK